jgi:glycosyltransferase involved in cell wall biosynthesis
MVQVGFVVMQGWGHQTHEMNLKQEVAKHADLQARWLPIHSVGRDVWERLPVAGLRLGLRTRASIERARHIAPLDALFIHTDSLALFSTDLMRRTPTVLSMDATPRGFDEIGAAYGHKVQSRWVERTKAALNRRSLCAAVKIIAMSQWAKRSLLFDYGVAESTVEVIPVSVDTRIWAPARVREDDGIVRFLFVGGDFVRKGGDLLLRWAKTTSARGWEIHVVTREAVPVTPGVEVHRLDNNSPALLDLARSCDVFVLPSRGDCSSFACVEALAVGLPVITTRVGGVPELIADGETGFTIPPSDFDALSDRMTHLLNSRSIRSAMSAAARQRALDLYDARRNYARIVDILRRVARGASPRWPSGGTPSRAA